MFNVIDILSIGGIDKISEFLLDDGELVEELQLVSVRSVELYAVLSGSCLQDLHCYLHSLFVLYYSNLYFIFVWRYFEFVTFFLEVAGQFVKQLVWISG